MLSSLKIKPLKTWIGLRSQSLSVKNRLIWEHREVVQKEQVNTIDRNDESTIDNVEENPILPIETQLRRSTRERQPSRKYTSDEYLLLSDGEKLENYQEVLLHDEKKEWLRVMHEEMKSLHKNNTYELIELPKGKRALKNNGY
ncbi:hypothetical protein PVL29_004649 [Vitis rotundifolia]|uniref:Uncharacterized protein n=1 Tax=Vitis rotundifolia TaxID=103349 RepID=A0AA39A9J7_VITRO|nr:hypothetical protein PVL29_004649 [Vitis rotundifolia]